MTGFFIGASLSVIFLIVVAIGSRKPISKICPRCGGRMDDREQSYPRISEDRFRGFKFEERNNGE